MNYKTHNNNKLNSRIIAYFSEIMAISEDCRKEYFANILSRKNSENQKNVRLIKTIYRIIEKNDVGRWNSRKICTELNMSMGSLYFHKHKILKGLRELHF